MYTTAIMFYKMLKIFNQINQVETYVYFLHGKNTQSRILSKKNINAFLIISRMFSSQTTSF